MDSLEVGCYPYWCLTICSQIAVGIATGSAASHAYLSDTTTPANRARVFSLMLGLLFSGIAVGPTLGGLLISKTGDLLSVFYFSAALHVIYLLFSLFVVPESLTKEAALANVEAARVKKGQDAISLAKKEENMGPVHKRVDRTLRTVFFFFSPLAIFIPSKPKAPRRRRDWNLTLLAISYGLVTLLMVGAQNCVLLSKLMIKFSGFISIQVSIRNLCLWVGFPRVGLLAQRYWYHASTASYFYPPRYVSSKLGTFRLLNYDSLYQVLWPQATSARHAGGGNDH